MVFVTVQNHVFLYGVVISEENLMIMLAVLYNSFYGFQVEIKFVYFNNEDVILP